MYGVSQYHGTTQQYSSTDPRRTASTDISPPVLRSALATKFINHDVDVDNILDSLLRDPSSASRTRRTRYKHSGDGTPEDVTTRERTVNLDNFTMASKSVDYSNVNEQSTSGREKHHKNVKLPATDYSRFDNEEYFKSLIEIDDLSMEGPNKENIDPLAAKSDKKSSSHDATNARSYTFPFTPKPRVFGERNKSKNSEEVHSGGTEGGATVFSTSTLNSNETTHLSMSSDQATVKVHLKSQSIQRDTTSYRDETRCLNEEINKALFSSPMSPEVPSPPIHNDYDRPSNNVSPTVVLPEEITTEEKTNRMNSTEYPSRRSPSRSNAWYSPYNDHDGSFYKILNVDPYSYSYRSSTPLDYLKYGVELSEKKENYVSQEISPVPEIPLPCQIKRESNTDICSDSPVRVQKDIPSNFSESRHNVIDHNRERSRGVCREDTRYYSLGLSPSPCPGKENDLFINDVESNASTVFDTHSPLTPYARRCVSTPLCDSYSSRSEFISPPPVQPETESHHRSSHGDSLTVDFGKIPKDLLFKGALQSLRRLRESLTMVNRHSNKPLVDDDSTYLSSIFERKWVIVGKSSDGSRRNEISGEITRVFTENDPHIEGISSNLVDPLVISSLINSLDASIYRSTQRQELLEHVAIPSSENTCEATKSLLGVVEWLLFKSQTYSDQVINNEGSIDRNDVNDLDIMKESVYIDNTDEIDSGNDESTECSDCDQTDSQNGTDSTEVFETPDNTPRSNPARVTTPMGHSVSWWTIAEDITKKISKVVLPFDAYSVSPSASPASKMKLPPNEDIAAEATQKKYRDLLSGFNTAFQDVVSEVVMHKSPQMKCNNDIKESVYHAIGPSGESPFVGVCTNSTLNRTSASVKAERSDEIGRLLEMVADALPGGNAKEIDVQLKNLIKEQHVREAEAHDGLESIRNQLQETNKKVRELTEEIDNATTPPSISLSIHKKDQQEIGEFLHQNSKDLCVVSEEMLRLERQYEVLLHSRRAKIIEYIEKSAASSNLIREEKKMATTRMNNFASTREDLKKEIKVLSVSEGKVRRFLRAEEAHRGLLCRLEEKLLKPAEDLSSFINSWENDIESHNNRTDVDGNDEVGINTDRVLF